MKISHHRQSRWWLILPGEPNAAAYPTWLLRLLIGTAAHITIGGYYFTANGGDANRVYIDRAIYTIAKNHGGHPTYTFDRLRPDIVHIKDSGIADVYEIKPITIGADIARKEALFYISVLSLAGVPAKLGPVKWPGTEQPVPVPLTGKFAWSIKWSCPEPGVIIYELIQRPKEEVEEKEPVPVLIPETAPLPKTFRWTGPDPDEVDQGWGNYI